MSSHARTIARYIARRAIGVQYGEARADTNRLFSTVCEIGCFATGSSWVAIRSIPRYRRPELDC